ncbi:MAG: hypothetical protein RIE73_12165 [Coleofasciculus sp. C1-SOL-03]|uniref:hypothetical protein n=1 Tax=Coleofasciculus sp. C1-SOL-03 TaxID=3069522 RepID=UPI003300E901
MEQQNPPFSPIMEQQNPPFSPIMEQQNPPAIAPQQPDARGVIRREFNSHG